MTFREPRSRKQRQRDAHRKFFDTMLIDSMSERGYTREQVKELKDEYDKTGTLPEVIFESDEIMTPELKELYTLQEKGGSRFYLLRRNRDEYYVSISMFHRELTFTPDLFGAVHFFTMDDLEKFLKERDEHSLINSKQYSILKFTLEVL